MTQLRPPVHFSIEKTLDGERHLLVLHGELDLKAAPALESEAARSPTSGSKQLVLDLSDLQFVDSSGLAVLVRAHQEAASNGHELTLSGRTPQVQRLFELTGVLDRFTFES